MPTPRRFSQVPYKGPKGSTELVLVRHGASADVVEGQDFELLDGHGDPPLSDIGRRQAELVGARLARRSSTLFMSPPSGAPWKRRLRSSG